MNLNKAVQDLSAVLRLKDSENSKQTLLDNIQIKIKVKLKSIKHIKARKLCKMPITSS